MRITSFNPRLIPAAIALMAVAVGALKLAASAAAAITPREPMVLFNGRDLSAFYTWLGASDMGDGERVHHGLNDPDGVFTVVQIDGAPAIRISGQHWGGIVTKERFANYRLVAEFRWGTWGARKNLTRDSGILLHCQGENGNYRPDFKAAWMRSVEFQIIEGGTGDLILVGGYDRGNPERISATFKSTVVPGVRHPLWSPDGTLTEFGGGKGGRVLWRYKDPELKNTTGSRGRRDAEEPLGEWNRLEAVCDGGNVAFFVNGLQVNGGQDCSFREGRILFQSEGAELYFRRIELHPLGR